ncbi:dcd1B, partial [Symbiodinium sp. KB8]
YGTPYQMGFAYGELMKNEIRSLFPKMETWIMNEINSAIGELPAPVRNWIDTYGIPAALNFTLYATGPHIPEHYWQLAYGLGNSTGLGWHKIMTTSLFPELIKAHCSMMGAWGEATAGIPGAGLVQLRALDWSTNGPFQEYPLLVTYHPEEGEGYTHTVLGWAGMMGAITGMGSNGMGVSEKVWLHYKGTQNVFGYPFPFLMQDLMWKCMDTDQALSKIASANRTCSIFIGIGDAKNNQFRALEYSHQTVNIYNDVNFPAYPPYHPLLKDLVFIDKHTQPSHHMCFGSLMEKLYGKLSPQNVISYVTALQQTGDTHAAVYDFGTSTMYVSNASPFVNGSATPAYNMPWSSLNMTQQWTLPPPTAM